MRNRKPSLLISLCLFLTVSIVLPVFSQQRWERTYGGSQDDVGNAVLQTRDGGYIIAGTTSSFGAGSNDIYLIKTDSLGDTLWTKAYGGTSSDCGNSVRITQDGGYIIVGYTYSFGHGQGDVYLIKTDSLGDTLWTRTCDARGDRGCDVQQTIDGGYIVLGNGNYDTLRIIKTDSLGDTLWTRSLVFGYPTGRAIIQTTDGGFAITGTVGDPYETLVMLLKTDSLGFRSWGAVYGEGLVGHDGYALQQTSDGGYIITGEHFSWPPGSGDVYLIKTDSQGVAQWLKSIGGSQRDVGLSVEQPPADWGYIITGMTNSFGSGYGDVYLFKTNYAGDTLWTRTYGGTEYDQGNSVRQTSDRGYIIAGSTYSFGNNSQVYLIKTDSLGRCSGVEEQPSSCYSPYTSPLAVFPNPFVSFASVPGHLSERFTLYDISGRKVGVYKSDRVGEGLSAGVYFLKPESGDAKPFRIVKLR